MQKFRLTGSETQLFWIVIGGTLLLKAILSVTLPLMGDEAYYILWSKHLTGGYYDHPPMIAWITAPFSALFSHPLGVRIPAILMSTLLAWGIYESLKKKDLSRARWTAVLFLLAPIHLIPVVLGPDTPLYLFSFFSIVVFQKAVEKKSSQWALFSGALLGLAFLSKYFALFIFAVYALWWLTEGRKKTSFELIAWVFLGALPFVLYHLYWNWNHCWINAVFNLQSRHGGGSGSFHTFLIFIAFQIYATTPFLLYYFWKNRKKWRSLLTGVSFLYLLSFLFPVTIFGLSTLKAEHGFHWSLPFLPFLYPVAGLLFSVKQLKHCALMMGIFLILHLGVFAYIRWNPSPFFPRFQGQSLTAFFYPKEVLAPFQDPPENVNLVTISYSLSSLASFYTGRYFSVLGPGSRFGRQDDWITDYRDHDGEDFWMFSLVDRTGQFQKYFESIRAEKYSVRGQTYYKIVGKGFRALPYLQGYPQDILKLYYSPFWIPERGCAVREKITLKNQ